MENNNKGLTTTDMLHELQKVVFGMKLVKNGIGRSGGGNFKYYTVEDVMHIVNTACQKTQIVLHTESIDLELIDGRWVCIIKIFLGQINNPHSKVFTFKGFYDTQQRNLVQSTGSTITYLTRYAYMSLLGIPDNAEDPDAKATPKEKKTKVTDIKPAKPKVVVKKQDKEEDLFDAFEKAGVEEVPEAAVISFSNKEEGDDYE